MTQTVLLTLGRLPKGLDIARSFHCAGWRVLVAEPFGWHLCGLSRSVDKSYRVPAPNIDQAAYLDALLALIAREGVSLVVPISEETMHVAALGVRLPDDVRLFTSSHQSVLALHDKLRFAHGIEQAGMAAPKTALLGSPEAQGIADVAPTIAKDRWGASGSNVTFLEQGKKVPDRRDALVQEWLEGDEVSSFSIVHAGRVSATVVYRPIIRDGTVSTVFERIDAPDVETYVARIAQWSGHTGFLSFDMMLTSAGPVAFECNPRANSGIHFLETADIAHAILEPGFVPRFNRHTRMQQAYPTLTLLWSAIGKWPRYRQIGKALFTSRDVTWRLNDPLPFALMTPATWPLLRQAMFEGRSLGEAAIHDIGWFGSPQR
ncbi:MAG: ATP-grasp domain-containing protein [Hyphomicrobiales bacterium]